MPPVTPTEKLEAEKCLRLSGSKQRITQPAIATEVARRRILCGDYGSVEAAGDDLGLSKRQRDELRKQLRESMPVRMLDGFFARADAAPALRWTPSPFAKLILEDVAEELAPGQPFAVQLVAVRAAVDAALPPSAKRWKLEEDRKYIDQCRERGEWGGGWRVPEPPGYDICERCSKELVPLWLEYDGFWCNFCEEPLCKNQLHFGCRECDFHMCHECSVHEVEWSKRGNAQPCGRPLGSGVERPCELSPEPEDVVFDVGGDVAVSGSRALILDFFGNGTSQARQATQIMRDAGFACRTLFASCQQRNSCGYNAAKWACQLWAHGKDKFHQFTLQEASEVLQPSFIAEQNVKLGYGYSIEARWLGSRRIIELATLDNPDAPGVEPWWLTCPAYDIFLEALNSTITNANDFRRGGLEIRIVNTDLASQRGTHWFLVAWVIE